MRIERLLFGSVLLLLVLSVGIAWVVPESEGVGGYPHDEFASMRQGGSGAARHGGILALGWAFGVLTILNFVLLVGFGGRHDGRLGSFGWPLAVAFIAYAGVFSWIIAAYRQYLVDPGGPLVLGFPLPSALMLYVLYPVSMILNVYFAVGFRRWVLTEEDEARYRELVARRRRQQASGQR